jgi:hypothetical protein
MNWESLRNNPLLAALLATVATGLGHLYLRRWLRAVGWLGVTVIASALFVPESAFSAIDSVTLSESLSILPIVFISAASALDAFLIAKMETRAEGSKTDDAVEPTSTDATPACPVCRKPIDPELQFCHWCTTEFETVDVTEPEQFDKGNSHER